MAFQTGFSPNHTDLLDKLRIFATANGWTQMEYVASDRLILRGSGSSATDQIYIGFQCVENVASDIYGWLLQGYTGYNAGSGFNAHQGSISNTPQLPIGKSIPNDNNYIKYWFMVSTRRIIVIIRIAAVYHMSYSGFIIPYAIPTQYPYPIAIGGSSYTLNNSTYHRYSDTGNWISSFWKPSSQSSGDFRRSSLALRNPSGWIRPDLASSITGNLGGVDADNGSVASGTWPFCETIKASVLQGDHDGLCYSQPNIDGSYVITPVMIVDNSPRNIYGEFEGIGHVSGFSQSAENTITVGADTWIVIPNIFRNGLTDWISVKLA